MKRITTATTAAFVLGSSTLVGFGSNSASAAPMTFLVDTLSDNPADGYTLREALADADANPGPDTIGFVAGLSGTMTLDGASLSSTDSVAIEGPADGGITIDAGGASRVMNSFFPGADLTIRNLTLTGGNAAFQGGALAVYQGGDVVIDTVSFIGNETAGDGGALSVGAISGTLDIVDSVFSGNTAATHGGALHVFEHDAGDAISIDRSTYTDNVSTAGRGGAVNATAPSSAINLNGVVVDGNQAVAGDAGGIHVAAEFVAMSDVAIINNSAGDDRGGAYIRASGANANLVALEIAGNTSGSEVGGATIRAGSFVNLSESRIHGNSAPSTAGLRLLAVEGVNVRRSTIESNEASAVIGGLAVIDTPQLLIEETSVRDNRAPEFGGLYVANVATSDIDYSTISGNSATAGDGGGIFTQAGAPTDELRLFNSTVSGNSATMRGGGARVAGPDLVVENSTVVDNHADVAGGGIFQTGVGAETTVDHSILTNNSAPAAANLNGPVAVEWSLVGDTTGVPFISVSNNLPSSDPLLGPLQDNGGPTATHLPAASSVVVDAGNPGLVLVGDPRDQRGAFRFSGPARDVGAVERTSDDGSIWTPVEPARIVDTRDDRSTIDGLDLGGGPLPADSQRIIDVAGRAGVPDDAVGVVANLTAVRPSKRGFLTAHPCADERPVAASLNYDGGVNLGNEIIIGLDAAGALCLYTLSQTHFTMDVVGYIGADSPYVPTEPARFLETRADRTTLDGESQAIGRLDAGETVEVAIRNRGEVAIDARAATLYVTAVRPEERGFLTIWNCRSERPVASSLNYVAGVNRGNEVVMNTQPKESKICIYSLSAVDLTVDVVGFVPDVPNNHMSLDAPVRLLETRPGRQTIDGQFEGDGIRTAGSILELQVAGRAGIPATAQTVTMNLTAVRPARRGFVTAFPCGGQRPTASSLNYIAGVNGGNDIVASLDDDGRVCLFTLSDTHLTADVTSFTTS